MNRPLNSLIALLSSLAPAVIKHSAKSRNITIISSRMEVNTNNLLVATKFLSSVICLWDAVTLETVGELGSPVDNAIIHNFDISNDDSLLISGDNQGRLLVWDLSSLQQTGRMQHGGCIVGVSFLHCSEYTAISLAQETFAIWDLVTYQQNYTIFTGQPYPRGVSINADDTTIVSYFGGDIIAWDISYVSRGLVKWGNNARKTVISLSSACTALSLAPIEPHVTAIGHEDGEIMIFNFESQQQILKMSVHAGPVAQICHASDGTHLYSCAEDGTVKILELGSGCLSTVIELLAYWMTLSPNSTRLATSIGGRVYIVDVTSGTLVSTLQGSYENVRYSNSSQFVILM
jgi:WD40 repeat protein